MKIKTQEYRIWSGMLSRCRNPRASNYFRYGGKGITVCNRWLKFDNFIKDMGNRPSQKHSIDRVDSRGNYEPSNCRWATHKEQQNNKTNNHLISHNGETRTITYWANYIGITPSALRWRIIHNWPIDKIFHNGRTLVYPPKNKGRYIEALGKRLNISDWARELGCTREVIYYQLKRGLTPRMAIAIISKRNV